MSDDSSGTRKPRRVPQPKCPIRFGEPCTACQPGTRGPDDCQLVDLVMDDPDLHERMLEMNRRMRQKRSFKQP
ncbi:DUF6767 domain-containing protein [Corynebacterium lactis]|uniref:DUF6767 domain-containing protein n=1 Tax=Corynebacterium lactis TaxID=1231000 RepID=UPI0009EAD2FC